MVFSRKLDKCLLGHESTDCEPSREKTEKKSVESVYEKLQFWFLRKPWVSKEVPLIFSQDSCIVNWISFVCFYSLFPLNSSSQHLYSFMSQSSPKGIKWYMNAALIHQVQSKINRALERCGWKANPPTAKWSDIRHSLRAFITVQNDYFEDA